MSELNVLLRQLPADAETVRLLSRTDWSRTPLGPVEQWPEALRIALGICMNSRFPMFIWWGDALINIYNDAYAPILGKRHPDAFGRPAQQIWSEIWDVVGPQAEAAMQRGEATWNERVLLVMERNGFSEETWFTWSYSPIPDGEGGIGGMFCACTEETAVVHAESERDRLLGEIAYERARLAEAFAQSPAFIATLRGPDHVFEFANERYLDLVGQRDLVGLPVLQALPEIEAQGFIPLLDRVYESGESYVGHALPVRVQRTRSRPVETRYVDFVYQAMHEADGRITGILVHGIDVTERRNAEARDRFSVELDEAVRPLTRAQDITQTCARLLGEYLDVDRCAYADVEADQDTFNLTGDYIRGVPSIVGRYTFAAFGEEGLRRLRSGEPCRVADVESHEPPIGDLAAYRQTGIHAVVCVPVLKSGRFVAAMAVHQAMPRRWTDDEVDLVVHVANRCWESIERARVERELRRSEQRFRSAIDATTNIFWNCSATGEFLSEQPGWAAFTGQTFQEYRGFGWTAAVHPEDVAPTLEQWNAAVDAQRMLATQHRLRNHDGSYRVCTVRAVPVPDETGQAREWVGTHTDISERAAFEQSLQESEARFRMLSDSAPVMIWMSGADGNVQYISRQWSDFTGQDQQRALGFGWLDAVHPDDVDRVTRGFLEKNACGEPFSIDYALRRHDGAYRWCVDTGSPRQGINGEFLGYIGTLTDITERKRAEETLASEKRVLELIATGSPMPEVLDTLLRGLESQSTDRMLASLLLVSEDGSRLQPVAAPSLRGRAGLESFPLAPGICPSSTAVLERRIVVACDLLGDPRWAGVHDVAAEAGLASCTATPVIGSDGRVLGTLALYYRQPREPGERDMELARLGSDLASIVIEKHELDQRLQRSLESEQEARSLAERANRMKDDFLATLSHELRSPLNAILGWTAIVRMKQQVPPELTQAMDVIERNARAQSQIIDDLLDMSAIVSGHVSLELERVRLVQVLTRAIETVTPAAQAKQIRLDAAFDPDADVETEADANRIQQVLWNLLSNAVKFTPRGGRIEVMLHSDGTQLRIGVRDSGEGIDPAFLPHVFDRFRQADSSISRRHGGLGLGLSIVRQIVELHGGRVYADSDGPGQGATFTVELPLPPPRAGAAVKGPGASAPVDLAHRLEGVRVLVVDDEADARLMTGRLLESSGADVATAASVAEALGRLTGQRFDVLVSDIGMPGQDGYELIRQLRADDTGPNRAINAVALTAYASTQDRMHALRSGFQQHLAKPAEPAALVELVKALANREPEHAPIA